MSYSGLEQIYKFYCIPASKPQHILQWRQRHAMPAAHSRPPPYFASKRGRCSHGRRAQAQPQPKASQPATCRSLSHRPATPAVWQAETGRTAMQKRPFCRPIQQAREPSHSRAATMQALPSPVPLPPRSGTGPAIPTKSDMAENARRNKTGPATALQPTNFHARHNSHGRHTLPMPRDWYGKKPPHCGKQPLVAWQKRLHNGKKRFARV